MDDFARWLFSVGQMKAGTTWFYESSLRCPEVSTPPVKELRILSTFERHGIPTLQEKMSSQSCESMECFTTDRRKTFLEYPRVFIQQFADLYGAVGRQPLTRESVVSFNGGFGTWRTHGRRNYSAGCRPGSPACTVWMPVPRT